MILYAVFCLASVTLGLAMDNVSHVDPRVIGGSPTEITKHPYMVSLLYSCDHVGGGSIISANYVLTGAVCLEKYEEEKDVSQYHVRVGSKYTYKGGTIHDIDRIVIHPLFRAKCRRIRDYDIAVLRLSVPVTFSKSVNTIHLPYQGEMVEPGTRAKFIGWGGDTTSTSHTDVLREVELEIASFDDCFESFYPPITLRMMCTVNKETELHPWTGDQGGPLVANYKLVAMFVENIQTEIQSYARYTDVASLREWIAETTGV